MNYEEKIGLGTVQFGLPYGISNTQGKTSDEEVSKILVLAKQKGINVVDTASAYGTSEYVLGRNNLEGFKIITKFMPPVDTQNIESQLNQSLGRLNCSSVYGFMAHRPQDVLANPVQWSELCDLKQRGLVKKIGFSFNEPFELDQVLSKGWMPDIVQVPFNYFDNRFEVLLRHLKTIGCEIHTRSAFLQGLFFMQTEALSSFFDIVKPSIKILQQNGECLSGLLLKYCLDKDFIDKVIIGVNNSQQLIDNIRFVYSDQQLPELFMSVPDEILMPSKWQINKI